MILINLMCAASCTKTGRDTTRLYMVYMNGSDLETDYGAATEDLSEMLEARLSENTRIVVQTGGTKVWHNDIVDASVNERFEIADQKMVKLWEGEAEIMGKASTLSDFICWSISAFPADEYYLIMWNHGGGAVSGFGKDEIFTQDTLMLSELSAALAQANAASGVKLNMIAFDACLMASIENIALITRTATISWQARNLSLPADFRISASFRPRTPEMRPTGASRSVWPKRISMRK